MKRPGAGGTKRDVQVAVLDNGLRVVTDSMDSVETVSLGVWVDVGARFETPEINGISHLLEHMAFKGTEKRSAQAIAEDMEAVGGHLNAYTSRENTAYYAKVLKEDAPLAVDIIADILQHSTLDEEELKRERAVIIQEINQANDTPEDVVYDRFQDSAFPGQALGRPVLGSAENVRELPRQTILDYMADHYTARRMVFAAAGRIDHSRVVDLVAEAFADLPARSEHDSEPARYGGGENREQRDLEQVQVVIGFDGMPYKDPDFYPASVFSTLFGGGMSSRLFQEVREKRGLVYSIYCFLSFYRDGGLFGVHAGTGAKEVGDLVPLICDELIRVGNDAGAEEVDRARAQLKAGMLMSLESTSSRCEQVARQMMVYGRPLPLSEIIEKIDAVDAAAVKRVALRLVSGTPTLASVGPLSALEDFEKTAARFA